MLRAQGRVACVLARGAIGLAALLAVSAVSVSADAKSRRHHQPAAEAEPYQPSYASIVVDANSGAVMQATNADSPRHPASLTKIMTLYLLFERLEAGKIKLTTEMSVSPHASIQAPSKLGLKPGETISVETAIRAIVTKSANDVAVIVAEALGGSEEEFAKLMTAKARALGMMHTTYHNASGLPDDRQFTTAQDMAILGRAIHDRFPQYYPYFSTRTFTFRGHTVRNHNHLLGSVDGLDGIKTGYIHDSGFNIVTSVQRNNRHIVAVVFGGRTAEARDARVRSLIANNINIAATKHTAPQIVEGWELAAARAKDEQPVKEKEKTVAAAPQPRDTSPGPGSTEPIKPNTVKTVAVQPASLRTAALSPPPLASHKLLPAPAKPASITTVSTIKGEPPALSAFEPQPGKSAQGAKVASAGASVPVPAAVSEAKPEKAVKENVKESTKESGKENGKSRGDWAIQVGAFDSETEARERLSTVGNSVAKDLLSRANPFTERVEKGDKAMYRARFAGLEKSQAETVCKTLKRSEIPCMLLRN